MNIKIASFSNNSPEEKQMFNVIELFFSQQFLIRALLVGLLITICCALLGVSLVLKRFSMIGDGLSHVSFGAMAIAASASITPIYFALPIVIFSAFLLLRMNEKSKIKGDAAIALISTGALAIGVMVISMTTGMNIDIYNYMFGSILTMSDSDVVISVLVSLVVITLFIVFYNEIFAVTFDESFAKATGTKVSFYNMLVALLTAVTIVIGMKMMGALLISSLIIFPTVTSMRVCKSFKKVVLSSCAVSIYCFVLGIFASVQFDAPTGASVVCANILVFLIFSVIKLIRGTSLTEVIKKALSAALIILLVGLSCALVFMSNTVVYKKDKLSIVTTAFAQYDFARNIVKDKADVTMLLAPGEESHTYEPSPGDIMLIENADVFVYGGGESENWVNDILSSIDTEIKIVRMMDVVELYEEENDNVIQQEHVDQEHSHSHEEEYDEHVWTSPLNAIKITQKISEAIIAADSINKEYYQNNTDSYIERLKKLDDNISLMCASAEKDYIIVADRFPLRYFTERYDLDYYAAFSGCSAQVEASPTTLANLIEKVKLEHISVIFKTDLSKGDVAFSVSESTGANVETLYSCHVITLEDFENGEGYISLMYRNLNAIKSALK